VFLIRFLFSILVEFRIDFFSHFSQSYSSMHKMFLCFVVFKLWSVQNSIAKGMRAPFC
jgi:hypothetical protein